MEKCSICGEELKLDLYTKSYFCPKCRSNNKSNNNADIIFVYNELNDFKKETYEFPVVKKLKNELNEYKIVDNIESLANVMVIFASRSSYLFSFRKYWSNFKGKIILVVKDLKEFDLPLELRNKMLIQIDDSNLTSILKKEIEQFKIERENHIDNAIKEEERNTFNSKYTTEDLIGMHLINSKVNNGIKECIDDYKQDIPEVKKPDKNYNNLIELLQQKEFLKVNGMVKRYILDDPNNPELYIIRLMSTLKIKSIKNLYEFEGNPLTNYNDFQEAYRLADNDYKKVLDEIVINQEKEMKYKKACIVITEMTTINEIKLAINILKSINPYKDSSELIKFYESELNKFIFTGNSNNINNYNVQYNRKTNNKQSIFAVVVFVAIVFFAIFMSIMKSIINI